MKFNYYSCLKATKATNQIELNQFLNWVKNPLTNPAYTQIKKVRESITKEQKNFHKEQLPCLLFGFTTVDGKKTLSSINGTTGCLFIDIDNPDFNPEKIINNSFLIACYKSSSGKGYHLLVSVINLSNQKEEFKQQVYEIAELIGIKSYIDERAIKRTQIAYLTFDENAIINNEYHTYEFKPFVPESKITKEKKEYLFHIKDMGTRQPIRFDDTDKIPFEDDEAYKVDFNEGFEITKAFLIPYKLSDNRYNTLLAYCNNLVFLNQHITKEKVLDILISVSDIISTNSYDKGRIKKIIDTIFRYKIEGKLEPIKFNKKRKIVFSPIMKTKLTKEEKQGIVLDEIAKNKTNQSKLRLQDIIENWCSIYGNITVRNIADNFPINIKTVSKYYKQFIKKINLINSIVPTSKIRKKPTVYMSDMGTRRWKRITSNRYLFVVNKKVAKSNKIQFMSTERFLKMVSYC